MISLWSRRSLTTAGRITVVKTLIIPKITHLLISIHNPPSKIILEIERNLLHYIWNSKTHKVSKNCIIQSYENGGLQMLCLKSFMQSLKITWIRRLFITNCSSAWKTFIECYFPKIVNLAIFGNMYTKKLACLRTNIFWKDVLCAFYEFRKCIDTEMSIKNPLWYNEHVKINGKCIFYKHWFEKGIYYIRDLYQHNGQIMSYEEFITQYSITVR